jgi:hypothetical protein
MSARSRAVAAVIPADEAASAVVGRVRLSPLATPAAAAGLLGIARLLPATGFGLWLRLAAATLIVFLPGRIVARSFGQRTLAATLGWTAALVGGALALTFALGASLYLTLACELGAGAIGLVPLLISWHVDGERLPGGARFMRGSLLVAGVGLGIGIWFAQGILKGDAFFHLGRMRKLDALGSLSLHDVGEFAHGGLHPGYAFPLWHGVMALVARLAGVDPTSVALHESSLLAPLALVIAFEMGWAIFRSTGLAFAVVLAQVAVKVLGPGHAGVYTLLWQPGTAATQLFAPAAVALFFGFLRRPSRLLALALAADSGALSLVHPTYTLFLAIPLTAFLLARLILTRGGDLRNGIGALAAFGVPMALAYAWLQPIVDQTYDVHQAARALKRSLHHYNLDLVVQSLTRYSLAPGRVDRSGAVAVAAFVLTPLAVLAWRRRWSAFVLGGTVGVLALELWPLVFPHFAAAVSLSQARRAATFVPFVVAFVGGASLVARYSRALALTLALGCGIWLQVAYGGDFGLRALREQPAIPVWIALYGGAAALLVGGVLAWVRRDPPPREVRARGVTVALATTLFVLPIVVHGFSSWSPEQARPYALTPGLIRFLQHDVPPRSVVFGDMGVSYEAIAFAPIYAVAVPPTHVARTRPNQVYMRRHAWIRFLKRPALGIARRWAAGWVVLRRSEPVAAVEQQGLLPVYKDRRFVVFKMPPPSVPLPPVPLP